MRSGRYFVGVKYSIAFQRVESLTPSTQPSISETNQYGFVISAMPRASYHDICVATKASPCQSPVPKSDQDRVSR